MKLQDYELLEGNHFIAMEYYNLIMNRTFLVLILEDFLIGLKVNGTIAVEGDLYLKSITKKIEIQDELQNPYAYQNSAYLQKIEHQNIYGEPILKIEKGSFKINRDDIKSVTHDKRKKWGMGYYPHDGKVYVKTKNGYKKEFIILGDQSGIEIKNWIEQR